MDRPARPSRPIKEAYFVRVAVDGERILFCDATAYIGKTLPYQKPQATCAMRVETDAVYFSLLHLTKNSAASFVAKPVKIPRGPFTKMANGTKTLNDTGAFDGDIVVVELDRGDEGVSAHRYTLTRDDNNVGKLEIVDGWGSGTDKDEDPTFTLPGRSVELRIYLKSARVGRTIAVNFVGHIGKPGTAETVGRAAAMVLNSICGLNEFRALAGLENMRVPAPPAKWARGTSPVRRDSEKVAFILPLQIFSSDYQPVAACELGVEIDLETSNQATGRLLFHLTPRQDLVDTFAPYKRIVDEALADHLRRALGDQLDMVVIDVVLGEVSPSTADTLREAVATLTGLDVTPREFRFHDIAEPPVVMTPPAPVAEPAVPAAPLLPPPPVAAVSD
jgi:hypothetical protein